MSEGVSYLRESLLSVPFPYALFAVFVAACVIGSICILVRIAFRVVPGVLRGLRGSRSAR
jgi:hypothetical protein